MKKTHKKILGILGLLVVTAVTIFAVTLPGPEASATSSVTDIVTVRVVGEAPNVDVIGLEPSETTTVAQHNIKVTYEVVDTVSVVLKYIDLDGIETEYVLANDVVDYAPGEYLFDLNLQDYGGYGEYILTVSGEGVDGVKDEKIVNFSFVPVTGSFSKDPETGNTVLELEYDPDTEDGTGTGEVSTVLVNIYDENGNLVTELSPITVTAPDKQVILPFDEHDLPAGNYTIELLAFDKDGNALYKKYIIDYYYGGEIEVPTTGAPDTGGLFGGLNISNADYLATGLLIFFVAGVCGIVFILRRDKKSSKRK